MRVSSVRRVVVILKSFLINTLIQTDTGLSFCGISLIERLAQSSIQAAFGSNGRQITHTITNAEKNEATSGEMVRHVLQLNRGISSASNHALRFLYALSKCCTTLSHSIATSSTDGHSHITARDLSLVHSGKR